MLRAFCIVLMAVPLLIADDFLKQLTPKDLSPKPPEIIVIPQVKISGPLTCAIPLKEHRVPNGSSMDKIAAPHAPENLDKGMVHPPPIPVCTEH
jgi:hypothetical protein